MPATASKAAIKWATRVFIVSAPLTVLTLLAWGLRLTPERPVLVFMVYQLLLLVSASAAAVAVVARGQLAIARAFTAGFNTALRVVDGDGDGDDRGKARPKPLRIVD